MNQETAALPIPSKKQVRKEISEKLAGALAEYKQELGEKQLAIRVKKASKLISRDLMKNNKKQKQAKKKTVKKAAPKKVKEIKVKSEAKAKQEAKAKS